MQKFHKTYKFKLKPTKAQARRFESWIGMCRLVYNVALNERIYYYEATGKSIRKYDQYNQLPELKKEFTFLKDLHSDVIQEVLDRLQKSYDNFFGGSGFPKWAKKGFYNSFTFKRNVKVFQNTIKFPKIGEVRYYNSRKIEGVVKTATIKKELDGWFVCITAETTVPPVTIDNSHAIGIDLGVAVFSSHSDGSTIESPKFLEPNLKKLRVLQRKLARQVKGSNKREVTKRSIQKLHAKITRQREDFLHKHSTKIADKYSACYMEDLKLQNMTKLNSTLSRRLLDLGFYKFRTNLEYKFKERSKMFLVVPPHYTSQDCSACGERDKKSRVSQSEYVCTSCGHTENADINAAKNIKDRGAILSTKRKVLA